MKNNIKLKYVGGESIKRIDSEIEQQIIKCYQNGKSCRAVGKQYNVSETTVFNILGRYNIPTRTKGGIYELPLEKVINSYTSGTSIMELAKIYNVSPSTICNYLEKANIPRNNLYHNLNLRRDYFSVIDSFDKAYYLGFLITDGCVGDNNCITLELQAEDDYILKILSNKICNENPIYYSPRNEASLSFKSQQIKDDLAKYGVVPRKTDLVYLPTLSDDMMPHLIRGMIDGDGWISVCSHQLGFCGNSNTVTQMRDYLVNKLGVYKVKVLQCGKHLYQVTWGAQDDIIKICEFLYDNKQDCYLIRKYENFLQIKDGYRKELNA